MIKWRSIWCASRMLACEWLSLLKFQDKFIVQKQCKWERKCFYRHFKLFIFIFNEFNPTRCWQMSCQLGFHLKWCKYVSFGMKFGRFELICVFTNLESRCSNVKCKITIVQSAGNQANEWRFNANASQQMKCTRNQRKQATICIYEYVRRCCGWNKIILVFDTHYARTLFWNSRDMNQKIY